MVAHCEHPQNFGVSLNTINFLRKLAGIRTAFKLFGPILAICLYNRACHLRRLDQNDGALACGLEAVELCGRLAEEKFVRYDHDLGLSLRNIAVGLAKLDRRDEALAHSLEVVELYWMLAECERSVKKYLSHDTFRVVWCNVIMLLY
jgi:hypothetical protein